VSGLHWRQWRGSGQHKAGTRYAAALAHVATARIARRRRSHRASPTLPHGLPGPSGGPGTFSVAPSPTRAPCAVRAWSQRAWRRHAVRGGASSRVHCSNRAQASLSSPTSPHGLPGPSGGPTTISVAPSPTRAPCAVRARSQRAWRRHAVRGGASSRDHCSNRAQASLSSPTPPHGLPGPSGGPTAQPSAWLRAQPAPRARSARGAAAALAHVLGSGVGRRGACTAVGRGSRRGRYP